ncbi:MAG: CocE/NonD family hydrolase [Pseudomonadota bacterium]
MLSIHIIKRSPVKSLRWLLAVLLSATACFIRFADAAERRELTRDQAIAYMESVDIERRVLIPMRDGVKLNADILFPDGPRKNLPTILFRTPYKFDPPYNDSQETLWHAKKIAHWLKEGYVIVLNHERGRHWSEGDYVFLAGAHRDGFDVIDWISKQPWSNGRVGTFGCSSSAEHQMQLAVANHPAHAAMIPAAPGCGIGVVGPYQEQGNWYRGGVPQGGWLSWYYNLGHRYRPQLPKGLSQKERVRMSRYFDIAPTMPGVNFSEALRYLPIMDLAENIGTPPSDFDGFIRMKPNDPKWKKISFANEGDKFGVPTLWVNSWYDFAVAPNIALFNHQRQNALTEEDRDNQYLIVGPTAHCRQGRETENTIVGERNLGDARYDYIGRYTAWFDHWLKGKENALPEHSKVEVFTLGSGWSDYEAFPPKESESLVLYLSSKGNANSLYGDGTLVRSPPKQPASDRFVYDPENPIITAMETRGYPFSVGNMGSYNNASIENRNDVLVYTSKPFETGIEVTGFIDVKLYVSSDARDTDFTIKLLDVDKDGRAWNIADDIQRARWREGYDKEVFMKNDEVYEVSIGPLATSAYFAEGHRIRIEVSSSNFPKYLRNLNSGGNNYDETEAVIANNVVHHSNLYPSHIALPVISKAKTTSGN